MAQTVPLGRLNADVLQVLEKHNLCDYSIGSRLAQLVFFSYLCLEPQIEMLMP